MVAPSFVTVTFFLECSSPSDYNILSIPFGPKVVLTRSATAIAPTNDYFKFKINFKCLKKKRHLAIELKLLTSLAISPLSSVAPTSNICGIMF